MPDEPMSVAKWGQGVQISSEALTGGYDLNAAFNRWRSATPTERAQWTRDAESKRAAERRAATSAVPLTLEALLDRVEQWGWSREYVEHLVQPYCECEDGRDGWEYCSHARDLGLVR
jgi:hypothetical protein